MEVYIARRDFNCEESKQLPYNVYAVKCARPIPVGRIVKARDSVAHSEKIQVG